MAQQPARQPQTQPSTQAQPSQDAPLPLDPEFRITTTVEEVQVPVWVFDKDGSYINNVRPEEFHLYDNDKDREHPV